jgi:general secretion pathway protein E
VVLRLLDRDAALLPLSDLGMPNDILASFRKLLGGQQGVILITGPTGSGKTTTLYAALQELDTEHTNVLTVEDPIEYQLPHIGQIQVKPKIGLTFAHGLRHILRQDPDVILVGETRDLETAEIMIRASLTGHLVFTTLHTNDAVSAVVRLADMGIEPYLLSASLRGALAQRLVRKLCPACRRPGRLTDEERGALGSLANQLDAASIWEAEGCDACLGGYRGRTGLYELMVVTEDVRAAIRGGMALDAVREMAAGAGMKSLLQSGVDAVARGQTSVTEVLRAVGTAAGESSG